VNAKRESERKVLMEKFGRPGGPGVRFKTHLDKLFKCLSLPKGAKEELGITGDELLSYDDEEEEATKVARQAKAHEDEEFDQAKEDEHEQKRFLRKMNAAIFGEGYFFLIPSFFRMLMFLKK